MPIRKLLKKSLLWVLTDPNKKETGADPIIALVENQIEQKEKDPKAIKQWTYLIKGTSKKEIFPSFSCS